ncbi:MAG: UDP-glucose/GDP-mannose dehydrogenase family protein [Deltaproteobacteria bacterium]|nr:UDP-glucose/GDP-mannose dehydrogenase family protein [Deltaproteobacteria bacterium]
MHVGVIGTGYVGLVTGACFAEMGNDVILMDIDEEKIRCLSEGRVPIYEPGLEQMIARNAAKKRLSFTTDLESTIEKSLINFIAVGTPPDSDGSADLSQVFQVAEEIGKALKTYKIIVTKSTVPVGTTKRVKEIMSAVTSHPFDVASNPEFLKEGNAIDDCMKPDRVVIGVDDVRVGEILKELYSAFVRTGNPIFIMDVQSSEMTKYAANGLLAAKISFMNELSRLAELVEADIEMVRAGIGSDPRIGNQFLFAGIGYGGSCFPKDVDALVRTGIEHGIHLKILESVQEANKFQRDHFCKKIVGHYGGGSLAGKLFAVWGLSFKPRTDDIREAPALDVIPALLKRGARVRVFDPVAMQNAQKVLGDSIQYAGSNYECLEGAHALIIVTEWNEFRHPDFEKIKNSLLEPVIFDGRNLYDPEKMLTMGFTYYCIGRGHGKRGSVLISNS